MKAVSASPFSTTPSRIPFLGVLAGVVLAATAHGQLLSDDFESYTPDAQLDTSGPWNSASFGSTSALVRDEATATPFGTPNQYFDLNDDSGGSVTVRSPNLGAASGAVTTFSFDFNEPAAGGAEYALIGYTTTNGDLTSAGGRLMVRLDDGSVTLLSSTADNSYALDASHRIYMIFNDTAAAVSYNGGSNSVAPGTADIWLDLNGGTLAFAGTRNAINTQTSSYRVGFRTYGTNQQQVLVDNVTLHEGVALPGNPPALVTTTPTDDELGITVATDLTAHFDRPIVAGTGSITIHRSSDDTTVASFDVTDPGQVAISGSSFTIDPPSDLEISTGYYVLIPDTAIENVVGDAFAGITDKTGWNFVTSTDSSPPVLVDTTPADNTTDVAIDANLIATFDEDLTAGTGNIVITNLTESMTFATIDITDTTQVTIAGTTVTINPASDFHEDRTYAVEIDAGALTDSSGNAFGGIVGTADWDFDTVPDTSDPILVSTTPSDGAGTASLTNNLVATFDEAIEADSGNITILNLSDSSTFATIPVGDAQVTINGNTLTIDPTDALAAGTDYAVQIDATALKDLSGNPFAGIVAPDVTTWNFTTTALASKDGIIGEIEGTEPALDYVPDSNGTYVGVSGATGGRTDRNLVLGYALPTLSVGETAGSVNFFFEITRARDSTGGANLPNLQVYLLDTADPDATGTDFFYHGNADPSANVALVDVTSVTISGSGDTNFADDEEDRVFTLSGDALALFQSFYGGDHIPDQPEVFFRFGLDPDPAVTTYRRYRIDLGDNESGIEVESVPSTPPVITTTLPSDDATGIYGGSTLVATFDRNIFAGSGDITIRNVTDDTVFDTIAVTNFQVTLSGPELIITPEFALDPAKEYAIQLDAGVVTDATGNPFDGIVDPDVTTWSFTTGTSAVMELATNAYITGRAQAAGQTPGYYTGGTISQIGAGGAGGARVDRNVVLSFSLPTLPVGESISAAALNFEISAYRNHSGADPALNVYLLDSADPSTTGTDFFYHGPSDPNPDVRFVGATDLSEPQGDQVSYGADEQDQEYIISGGALALLRSLYGGDHIPEQTEVYFRFNLDNLIIGTGDADLDGSTFDRYFLELLESENRLEIVSSPGGGSGGDTFTDWIAGFSVGGMTGITDDADGDGTDNGVENFFGTAPDASSAGLVSGDASGGAFSFTHPQSASPASDLTAAYVWTTDLAAAFNADGATDGNGTTVTFTTQADTPSAGMTTVTANVTGTAIDRLFVRVEVTQN